MLCIASAGKFFHGHAKQREREYRFASIAVDVGYRVGCRNAAKVIGIIHDRQKEVGVADQGLLIVQTIDGSIVARLPSQPAGWE